MTLLSVAPNANAATGIVIRLITGGESVSSPVVATLTNAEGTAHTATLVDNGEPPDVNAGDHHFSGSSMLDGEAFQVTLSLGDETEDVGEVSWPADVAARDLVITRYEGIVTLETGAGSNDGPIGTPEAGDQVSGPVAGPSGGDATNATARAPTVSFAGGDSPVSSGGDSTLYVIGGILLLILAAVAYFWFKPEDTKTTPVRFSGSVAAHQLPQPGLLGEGSPSLSDGATVWIVDAPDTEAFISLLLSQMASHHRVLVVAPGTDSIPLTAGGPVFRMKNPRPTHVADAVNSLLVNPGNPMAILIKATSVDANTINDYCELLPGAVGTTIVVNEAYAGPEQQVTVKREPNGWRLDTTGGVVRLTMNPWGMSSVLTQTQNA